MTTPLTAPLTAPLTQAPSNEALTLPAACGACGAESRQSDLLPPDEEAVLRRVIGAEWVRRLDAEVALRSREWGLRDVHHLGSGHNGVVLACTQDGGERVLKISGTEAQAREQAKALAGLPNGTGPRLHGANGNALLLQRLRPGKALSEEGKENGHVHLHDLLEAAELLHRIHQGESGDAPQVEAEWERSILDAAGAPGAHRALIHLHSLEAVTARRIHGDAHLGNVLRTDQGLRAVDPEDRSGDPAYDIARLCLLWPEHLPGGPDELIEELADHVGYSVRRTQTWGRVIAWGHARYLEWFTNDAAHPEVQRLRAHAASPVP